MGGFEVEGEVLGFDGTYLLLQTDAGEVTLDYRDASCAGTDCPDLETWVPSLRLSGASRLGELILPALVEGYARARGLRAERTETGGLVIYDLATAEGAPLVSLSLNLTTTEDGLADLVAQEADAAMAARLLTEDELALAEQAGLGRLDGPGRMLVVAFDALVPVVGVGQPVRRLRLDQLARILGGDLVDWAELGGPPGEIRLHLGEAEGGEVQGAAWALLGPEGRIAARTIGHRDFEAAAAAVAADPQGLALVPFDAPSLTHPMTLFGPCGLVLAPRPEAIRAADYPLTTPLLLYLPQRRMPEAVLDFLSWLPTVEAQLVLRRAGVLGLAAVPIPVAVQGERLAAAITSAGPEVTLEDLQAVVSFLRGRVRLSPTYRFEGEGTALDPVSRAQVLNLAQAIRDGTHDGRPLWLVGFSDALGPAEEALAQSRDRAEAVRAAVVAALGGSLPPGVALNVAAFGEALPTACDDSPWGRALNRRVELWTGDAEP